MILDLLDIIVIESNIEITEYVMESARFEVDGGNDKFIPIYEAAEETSKKENSNWISIIINKIKKFVTSTITSIRLAIKRFGTLRKINKVNKLATKIYSKNGFNNASIPTSSVQTEFYVVEKYTSGRIDYNKINDYIGYAEKMIYNEKIPKSFQDFEKDYLNIDQDITLNDRVTDVDVIAALNLTSKWLSAFVNSTTYLPACINRLADHGVPNTEIRKGFSTMISYMENALHSLYINVIKVANYFISHFNKDNENYSA